MHSRSSILLLSVCFLTDLGFSQRAFARPEFGSASSTAVKRACTWVEQRTKAIEDMLQALRSADPHLRQLASDGLTSLGLDAVAPVLNAMGYSQWKRAAEMNLAGVLARLLWCQPTGVGQRLAAYHEINGALGDRNANVVTGALQTLVELAQIEATEDLCSVSLFCPKLWSHSDGGNTGGDPCGRVRPGD